MNQTLDVIHKRRSVRKYVQEPLSEEIRQAILSAAMRAPTAGNMMLYTIIEVSDQKIKDQLVETCDSQAFIATAPFMLLFLADYQRWFDMYQAGGCEARADELGNDTRLPSEGDLVLALMDAMIAAQTSVIAAESLGVSSCYIGDIVENWEEHQAIFDLPKYTFPAALLCFGAAADEEPENLQPRFPEQFIVHKDRYQRFSPEELNEMYTPFGTKSFEPREFPKTGAQNLVQMNYLRKFTAAFTFEMTRSVREMIKSWCS